MRSTRQGFDVPLPMRSKWAVNDEQELWLVAQHAPSHSELRLRSWRARRSNSAEGCARQARLWRPDIPDPPPNGALEHRPLEAPEGYRGEVLVTVAPRGSDAVEGHVVAIGARTGRCFALWYRTRVAGARAEAIVGDNLAVVSGGVVDRLREIGIEDVIGREPGRF